MSGEGLQSRRGGRRGRAQAPPRRPNTSVLDAPEAFGYHAFTRAFRRGRGRGKPCATRTSSSGFAAFLDKQLSLLHVAVSRLANRLQRRLLAQQNRAWEFDLEEGIARRRAAIARRHRSVSAPIVQARARHDLPRHGGDAAARQFRLDARKADHGRRLLRRYPRTHARALRREGRDPRLHDAAMEGRPVAREMACRGQTRQSRPPQRSAPHRLQSRRYTLAAGAAQSRA